MQVLLTDRNIPYEEADQYFKEAGMWAQNFCPSFKGYHVQDVSDVSYQYDLVASYEIEDEKDVVWFKLRWTQ